MSVKGRGIFPSTPDPCLVSDFELRISVFEPELLVSWRHGVLTR